MRSFYKCKYFKIQELVDRVTYEKFGEQAWMFFDVRLLKTLDGIREYFNSPIIVNNWHLGGNLDSRGFRRPDDKTGALYSQHRFGRAVDFTVTGRTAEEVRKIIIDNQNIFPFNEITAMELDVDWVHIDFRNINSDVIYLFKG
jgi:hypothetical protein